MALLPMLTSLSSPLGPAGATLKTKSTRHIHRTSPSLQPRGDPSTLESLDGIMKLSFVAILTLASAASAFVVRSKHSSFQRTFLVHSTTTDTEKKIPTKKEERLRFMKSNQFHRKGFKEVRDQVEETMQDEYNSAVVQDLKSNNHVMSKDGVQVHLAKVSICT